MNKVCLASCWLPKTEEVCEIWNRIQTQLEIRGIDLVLISADTCSQLRVPVIQIPFALIQCAELFSGNVDRSTLRIDAEVCDTLDRDAAWVAQDYDRDVGLRGYHGSRAIHNVLLDALNPSLVLVWGDTAPHNNLLRQLAKIRAIPAYTVERGILPGTFMVEPVGHGPDSVLLNDKELIAQILANSSLQPYEQFRSLYVGGVLDKYAQPNLGEALQAPEGHTKIVFLGQQPVASGLVPRSGYSRALSPLFSDQTDAIAGLIQSLREIGAPATVFFKPHPNDPADYADELGNLPITVVRDTNIRDLISASDLVAVMNSTVQFEALLFEKPLLLLAKSQLSGKAIAYEAAEEEPLAAVLRQALHCVDWDSRLQRAKRFISGVLRYYLYSVRDDIAAGKDVSSLAEFIAASSSERRPNLQLGMALKLFYARFERLRQSRSALLTVDAGFAKYESPQDSDDRVEAESVRCHKDEFPLLRREFLYQKWRKRHQLTAVDVSLLEQRMRTLWASTPSVHVVLIDARGSDGALERTVASVVSQIYPEWGLSIISNEECVIADLDTLPHIEWLQTCDVAWALRHVVEQSPGEWICFLFSGDILEKDCFVSLLDLADVSGACEVLYADADSVDEKGECFAPEFKPDFDIDLLRSSDFFGNGCLLRTETIKSALRLVSFEDFGFLYGLLLSIAERNGEAAFVHDSKVLFHSSREGKAALFSQRARDSRWRYLESHLDRLGMKATIAEGYIPGTFRVDYLHDKMPLVSIIIPTKDSLGVLRPCVESLLEKTGYRRFEVLIVDNNSEKPETLAFFDSIQKRDPRVRVLTYPKPYNFSRINNFAAEHATGEYLLLLNNDTAVLHENWLEQMLSLGQRKDVGIVGARLLHPDNTVQHAGVVVGMSGVADHPEIGLPAKAPGYLGQAQLIRGMSAVTAACLLIEKSLYLEVRGLDEDRFAVLFNDVDLCLKVKQRGLRVLWTPYACLMHHGSFSLKKTAGRHIEKQRGRREALAMLDKWMPVLARDGSHNINLSLMDRAVQPETLVDAKWDMHRRDRMRVLAFPFDSWGTGHYRVRSPLTRLQEEDRLRCSFAPEHAGKGALVRIPQPVEVERIQPDVLFLHAALHDVHIQLLEQYRKYNKSVFKVFGLDDLLHSPPPRHRLHKVGYKDIKKRIRKALSMCDRLVVSTEPLAEAYADMIDDIGVIPNALDPRRWLGIDAYKRTARKPRVGWAGGRQHGIDLDIIVPVMTEIGDAVEWVFLGDKPQGTDRLDVEFHEGVFFDEYPAKLASLNLDLAIAPLHVCAFNEAKSNLRILEYGIFGIPVVCTDIYPYQDAPVTRVKNRASEWINAIREHVHDVAEAERKGTVLQRWVKANYMLDRYQDAWLRALDSEAESAAPPETAFRERFCQVKP